MNASNTISKTQHTMKYLFWKTLEKTKNKIKKEKLKLKLKFNDFKCKVCFKKRKRLLSLILPTGCLHDGVPCGKYEKL